MQKPMSNEKEIIFLDPNLEQKLRAQMTEDDVTPPLLNLVRGATAAHEHAFHFPELSKDAFLKFMGDAWDFGLHQRKVYSMQVEGGMMNALGVVLGPASHLALFGEREGLLPKN